MNKTCKKKRWRRRLLKYQETVTYYKKQILHAIATWNLQCLVFDTFVLKNWLTETTWKLSTKFEYTNSIIFKRSPWKGGIAEKYTVIQSPYPGESSC